MDHRCEARIVIGRDLADPSLFFGFRVDAGIDAAYKPEHGWSAPFEPERAEVFARGRRLGFLHTVRGKVPTKRVAHSFGRLRIVCDKRITVQSRDLRRCVDLHIPTTPEQPHPTDSGPSINWTLCQRWA